MVKRAVFIADPGIDSAFALTLAMLDENLEALGIAATAGNVDAEQATRNVHAVIEQVDPPRWPRVGYAPPVAYELNGAALHGPGGLGGVSFPVARLHNPHQSDKLVIDLVKQYPGEVTVVVLGPPTVFASALDLYPELASQVERLVVVGGAWHEPGNATAAAEFHFYCDPLAARQVLRCGAPITLIPLDAARKVILSPKDLLELPNPDSRASRFLSKIVPFALGATANLYGIEGFHLKDVLGTVAVAVPDALATRPVYVDVEQRGELTRGMTIFDTRWVCREKPNALVVTGVDVNAVRKYIDATLSLSGG
jgi:inosine-uridine nucleoside N-ribohydrolase